jgi:signal transduction histidine kinase
MAKALETLKQTATRVRASLAGRILFSFLLMALLSLVIALVGIYVTSQAGNELAALLEQDRNFTGTVLTMERAAERQNSSVRAFLNRVGKEAETELAASIRDYEQSDAKLQEILAGLNLPPDKYQLVKDRYELYSERVRYIRSLDIEAFRTAPIYLWESDNSPQNGPLLKEKLIQAIEDLLAVYRAQSNKRIEDARNQGLNVTIVALTLVTITGILAVFVASVMTRNITRPLRKLAGVARAIRQGNLDVQVPVMRGEDEVANLAGAMGSMAENLRFSRRELEASLDETSRRNRELTAVNRVAATIGQSLDLDQVLHEALDELMDVAEMEYGSIFLMEPDGQSLRLHAYHNQSEDYARQYNRLEVGEQLTGEVAQTGKVLLQEFPANDPRTTHPVLRKENYKRFYLGVPLKSKGQVVGVVDLTSQTVRQIEQRDLDLLSAIGNQIGIAVDNARLYQQAQQIASLEERNRLARDLHDSVTQTLFSITLTAESAKAMMTRRPEKVEAQVDRLQNLARGALAEMRALIFQLRPAALQEQGLIAALEKHVAAIRAKEPFEVDLNIVGDRRLSEEHEQTLYRIMQEAFNNIIKYAHASHVWVSLIIDDQEASLTIRDDGQGFDAATVLAQRNRSSLGLTSMRERAELSGGTFTIESSPGNGTTISVRLSLSVAPRPVGMGIN